MRLTLAEETYIGNGTSIKRAQQDGQFITYSHSFIPFLVFLAAEQALNATALKRPETNARTSHVARPIRGIPNRGSKFHFNRDFLLGKQFDDFHDWRGSYHFLL